MDDAAHYENEPLAAAFTKVSSIHQTGSRR
jgi:hypothetical protein